MAVNPVRVLGRTVHLWLALAVLTVGGCGGGGKDSTPPPPATVVIQGIVTDDPVEGATVTLTALADNAVLATTVSNASGVYTTPAIVESRLSSGYRVTATGGTSLGSAFVGTLSAVYSSPADYALSHITIPMTAVTRAAERAVTDSRQLAAKVDEVGALAVARGLLSSDWRQITAAIDFARTVAGDIAQEGVDGYTSRLAWELVFAPVVPSTGTVCVNDPSGANGRICAAVVGPAGGTVRSASGESAGSAVVTIPNDATSNCILEVRAAIDDRDQSVRVTFARALGATQAASCNVLAAARPSRAYTLTLPPNPIGLPDPCESPAHEEMPTCVRETGIGTAVFVTDRETHRVDLESHTTASVTATIKRRYGAMLKRSEPANVTLRTASAVLFVHGYTPLGGFGGGDSILSSTWGSLPRLVKLQRDPADPLVYLFEPYNFQWRTNASFLNVARDLAAAIDKAYRDTGQKKVHIVAHSFGGVLARVVLQRTAPGAMDVSDKVASLTTVGTPHSGIHEGGPDNPFSLPDGWAPWDVGLNCGQISCYQMGLVRATEIADWAKAALNPSGTPPVAGYVSHDLFNTTNRLPSGLKLQVLLGQTILRAQPPNSPARDTFRDGDGLISYRGQRFLPTAGETSLKLEDRGSDTGGAVVTERFLGLLEGVNPIPGTEVGTTALSRYMTTDGALAALGYVHAVLFNAIRFGDQEFEVNIKSTCNGPDTCYHDTWLNIRALLLSLHGGSPSPNFPTTTGLAVSSASCTQPVVGQLMTCTVVGVNLPVNVSFTASNCGPSPMTVAVGGTGFQRQFTCTPITAGVSVVVSYVVPGFLGPVPPVATVIAGDPSPGSAVVSGLNDTGIGGSQCYAEGISNVVSCTSAGAIALNSQQDGMVGRDVDQNDSSDGRRGFSFSLVPSSAGGFYDRTECVRDNVTGLVWEGKTVGGGVRDGTRSYTNIGDGRTGDASSYVTTVNALAVCGRTNWRLPTVEELHDLVDYGLTFPGPTIDATWFPNTRASTYWTSTSWVTLPAEAAWIVNFVRGGTDYLGNRFFRSDPVRLVSTRP